MQLKPKKKKKEKKNQAGTHDLYDAEAVLYQLNYQVKWELVIL